jgi:hypothetical protein
MDKLVKFAESARLWLEGNIGLGAAFAVNILIVFLFVYAFRKLCPNGWIWLVKRIPYIDFDETPIRAFLDKALQTLPGTIFAAVMGAVSSGGSIKVAALGALAGPLASAAHHILEAIPWIPYRGRLGSAAKQRFTPPPMPVIIFSLFGFGLLGCSLFGSQGVVWPAVAKCAPEPADAFDVVKDALLSGSGYKTVLEDAAKKYGPSTVLCLVDRLVAEWGNPTSSAYASPDAQAARLRGEAFLKETGSKVEQ